MGEPRSAAGATSAAASQGDYPAGDACAGEGPDAGAAEDVFQGESAQGRAGSLPGQEAVRQARGHRQTRRRARVGARQQISPAGIVTGFATLLDVWQANIRGIL